jgi:hypothetical protein
MYTHTSIYTNTLVYYVYIYVYKIHTTKYVIIISEEPYVKAGRFRITRTDKVPDRSRNYRGKKLSLNHITVYHSH